MKSAQHRDQIVRKEKVIGFEMEGDGVWDNVSCIIVKGDSHKSKSWRLYAAATGASASKAFLEYWEPFDTLDAVTKRHLILPLARNSCFVGRHNELGRLDELLSMPDGPKNLAITGLGGVGKTQVALELAYRLQDKDAECSIFWIQCTSTETFEQAFITIAQAVGIQHGSPSEVKEHVKSHFSQNSRKWLLIFDNADDTDMWTKGNSTTPE
ncbi:hypothetical protein BDW59DRAFT_92005 [Aspergillus cavernicola]|uniref:ORC1/DEAH AAA+ ATPase domain-containing protein n=1 Tax=Aspergillus cavernicola TaxID=176166 RepID=A0ABR4I7Q2_9EURO